MSSLIIKGIQKTKVFSNTKLLVFDMAGTTVNERGIVYKTLYKTIKDFGIKIKKEEINDWHGFNKYEVLNYFLLKQKTSKNLY